MGDREELQQVRKMLGKIDPVGRTTMSTSLFDIMTTTEMPRRMKKLKYRTKEKYFAALRKETSPIPQLPKAVKSKTKKIGGKQAKKTEKPEDEEKKDEASDEAEDSDFGQVVENLKVLKKWKDEAWKEGLDMKLVEETGQSMEDEKEYLQVTSP